MRYSRQSVALKYDDLNYIDKRKPKLKSIKSKQVSVFGLIPFQAFMLLVVLISMVAYLIYNKVLLDKIESEIIQCRKNYEDVLSEKVRLEVDMESKISLKNLEEVARKKGLAPVQDYQIEYVDFQTKDNIEVVRNGNARFEKIQNFLNGILAYIK